MCSAMQVLELVIDQQDSSLRITVLHDLGAFPQWTMDARIVSQQPPGIAGAACAIIGLSNNTICAFCCGRAEPGAGQSPAQHYWTASCREELLLYSMALRMADTVPWITPACFLRHS